MAVTFHTFQKTVTTSGTPVQLTTFTVEPDQVLLVKAKSANTGNITVGNSSAKALNSSGSNVVLAAGLAIELTVPDAGEVWIDATVSGEGVEVAVGGELAAGGTTNAAGSLKTTLPGATKTRTALAAAVTLTAGAANTTSSTINLSAAYGAQVSIQITNGATGPTVPAQVQVMVANDAAATLFVNYGGALVASVTNSAVTSWSVDLPPGISAVKIVSGSNTVQAVTLDADISVITAF